MKQKNKFSIVFLALVVVVSGCADSTQDETSGTSPIQVNDFSVTPDPVPADRTGRFTVELENTGDEDAENVAVRLFGPTLVTDQKLTWRDREGGAVETGERTETFDTLRASTEDNPSIPKTRTFSLTAPAYGEGKTVDDTFYMKLFYQYQTDARTGLTIMTDERSRETGATASQPTVQNTAGPIQMDVRGVIPKVYYGDGSDRSEELCVTVTNKGDGTPFVADNTSINGEDNWKVPSALVGGDRVYNLKDEDDSNTGFVELTVEDVGNIDFTPQDGRVREQDPGNMNAALVEMIDGSGYQCFDWEVEGGLSQEEQTVNLEITADYGYVKEDSTTVTTEGRVGARDN